MINPVMELLANPTRDADLAVFLNWCRLKRVRSLPASPTDLAMFVIECETFGIDTLAAAVGAVGSAHRSRGLADPTSGFPVSVALNRIAKIDLPKGWAEAERKDWDSLPYQLQRRLSERQEGRDKYLRSLRSDADKWRAHAKKEMVVDEASPNGRSDRGAASGD